MTTARTLEATEGSILTFKEILFGGTLWGKPYGPDFPELSPFEGQQFRVDTITEEGIVGQAFVQMTGEIISPPIKIGLDENIFKLNQ